VDGRRAKRFDIFQNVLDQAARDNQTASVPGIEKYLKQLLSIFLLSPSAERQYIDALMKLLRLEAGHPGKRVDLSSGMVKLVDRPAVNPLTVQP
jgi:hypothetical protein